MRTTRRLALKKEVLTELRADELTFVVGGDAVTEPLGGCATTIASKVVECDSNLRPCVSHTCTR